MLSEEKKKRTSKTQPLVSVITPLYNARAFIFDTIRSVQLQTYENWEHIIVDDASSDNAPKQIKEWIVKDPRIKLFQLPENKGAAFARNFATDKAQGHYIAFLDSDDLWHKQKLEQQVQFMQQYDTGVSLTNYLHIDEAGNSLNKRIKALPEVSFNKQLYNNYIGNLTGIYSVEKLGKIFAPDIRKRQDWAVWLEAIKRNEAGALGLQKDLGFYRVRKGSMSSNKIKLVSYNFHFYRTYLKYSWLRSTLCLLRFFWEYFVQRPKQIEDL